MIPLTEVADARAADPELSGPFAGVPFLIKDLGQEYAGFPTSNGSRALADDVAEEHALVTRRFLDAGLVIFGKTNTPEFGAKGVTEPDLFGPARNPFNLAHTPGGSSGGSGAAVAAGIVPAAGANDGGGSVRIPAACNGLVGLKTSRGLGPYGPQTGEVMFGMVTQGVVSRTVRDSAGLLDAIIAPDPGAGYQAAQPPTPFTELVRQRARHAAHRRTPRRRRSTPAPTPRRSPRSSPPWHCSPSSGHQVEEVKPPHDDEALARDFLTIWFGQLHGQVADVKRRLGAKDSDFEADTLASAELGRAAGMVALLRSLANVNDYIRALTRFHETYDLFLTPTLAKPPLEVGATTTPRPVAEGRPGGGQGAGRQAALGLRHPRPADLRQHRLGALHPAREPDRSSRDQRAAALDAAGSAARRTARRPPRRRRAPAAARRAARGGAPVVPPLRRAGPRSR